MKALQQELENLSGKPDSSKLSSPETPVTDPKSGPSEPLTPGSFSSPEPVTPNIMQQRAETSQGHMLSQPGPPERFDVSIHTGKDGKKFVFSKSRQTSKWLPDDMPDNSIICKNSQGEEHIAPAVSFGPGRSMFVEDLFSEPIVPVLPPSPETLPPDVEMPSAVPPASHGPGCPPTPPAAALQGTPPPGPPDSLLHSEGPMVPPSQEVEDPAMGLPPSPLRGPPAPPESPPSGDE